ncbi:hypothetical protein [Paraburkholderia sp.]|nr:hypothetical protein [Paraburkholderia sp.]MDE1180575.1 hypothetical protein [Paraburkholderia sp.]
MSNSRWWVTDLNDRIAFMVAELPGSRAGMSPTLRSSDVTR